MHCVVGFITLLLLQQAKVATTLLDAESFFHHAAMEIIYNLRSAASQQREDWAANCFSNVNDLREYISAREPGANINITAKMSYYSTEGLSAINESRTTLVNSSARRTSRKRKAVVSRG